MEEKLINIILCPFDNGIRSMQQFGRGNQAPQIIFETLKKEINVNQISIPVEDFNTGVNEDTIKAHEIISSFINKTKKPFIVLGGDHSITYPILRGLVNEGSLGLIYFDAHYDLRPLEGDGVISSGNSFYRIINDKQINVKGENMVAIGILKSESEMFKSMDEFALTNNMTVFYQDEINSQNIKEIMSKALEIAGENTNGIYLSVDIDVCNQKYAPGVSCPAKNGLELKDVISMISMGKFIGVDIAEASIRERSWKGGYRPIW